jgi:succinate dehydrogenase / fumarate reductase cytochrome b subunit
MSTIAIRPVTRAVRFYEAPIGKKAVMAVTGLVLLGYVIGHLIGNLQIFIGQGPDSQINHYAAFLHDPSRAVLLWAVRGFLLLCVVLHIIASAQLWLQNRAARPVPYYKKDDVPAAYAARTMVWSGPIIAAFIIFHVLHLTAGGVVPLRDVDGNPNMPDVRANVIYGFHDHPAIAAFYIFAMVLLTMHLYHGVWSLFQSLGANSPRYITGLKRAAAICAIVIAAGTIVIPISAVAGWLTY